MFETLGQRVERLRTSMGWQKKQLALRAQLDPSHIGLIESGARTGVRPENLEKLADAFKVSVNYLVTGREGPASQLEEYGAAVELARKAGITPNGLLGLVEAVVKTKPQAP